jgi:ribosomal protein L31E
MVEERIYTVPLRRGFLKAANYDRSRKAVVVLKEFLKKHLKKDVKVGKYLNLEIWKDGRKKPPGKVQVRIEDDEGVLTAELINAPREKKVEVKKEEKKKEIKEAKEIKEEAKEKIKEAIEKVPEKEKIVDSDKKVAEPVEKEHAHRKEEKVIPQN